MKGKITLEYIRRGKKLCRAKLNGGSLVGAVSTLAVDVERYSAGMVDWRMEEMASMGKAYTESLSNKHQM